MRFNNIDIRSENDSELTETIRSESSHIIDMYLRQLKFYDNDNCKKLNISCNEKISHPFIQSCQNGNISLQMPFHSSHFQSLSPKEKSYFYLNLIHQSILFIGKQWGWNLPYFDFLRNDIISRNYKNQWMYGKPFQFLSENKFASLRVVQTIDRAVISLIITQNKKVIHKIELIKTEPSFWIYRQYLGEIQWISRDCLKVYDKNGKVIFDVTQI